MKASLICFFLACVTVGFPGSPASSADAETDWNAIIALDSGPQEYARTREAARAMAVAHMIQQERALRTFIASHPEDAHVFEARLRLARLLQNRGNFEDSRKLRAEGQRLLDDLEKTAAPGQKAEIDFSRIAQRMRALREPTAADSEALLSVARKFEADHPDDRRVAELLTEVATLFDDQPRTKEDILLDAQRVATGEELKRRIGDDLKRVHLLGEEIPLQFTSVQGRDTKLGDFRGKPVILIFFADFSIPSANAVAAVQRAEAALPKGSVQVVGVSLDNTREELAALIKARGLAWPIAYDGKGWESPLLRPLGINALPTVWLLDQEGRLRSINGLENLTAKVRKLIERR